MAVAFDASSESATASTGSASVASFSWSHAGAASGVKGALVFTFVNAGNDDATSVTYGGTSMTAVTGGRGVDTLTEAGDCKAWFLGTSVPQGTQTVVVNRTNNADVMYAVAITVTAATDTETFDVMTLNENQALAEYGIHNGSSVDGMRFAGVNSGLATHPAAGASSTELQFFPATAGTRSITVVRETTAGSGSRKVGFSGATDDVGAVYLCVREVVTDSYDITFDCLINPASTESDTTAITTAAQMQGYNCGAQDWAGVTATAAFTLTTPTGLTKDALQTNQGPLNSIRILNRGVFSKTATWKTIGINHNNTTMYWEQDISSQAKRKLTLAGVLYLDIPDQGVSGQLYDFYGFFGEITGEFAMMQFSSGSGALGYGFDIESNPGGTTVHSSLINPGTTPKLIWFSFQVDFTGGTATLNIYDYPAMTLIGSVTRTQTTGENIAHTRAGCDGHGGTVSGHKSYMWAGLDWTSAVFPLIPTVSGVAPSNRFPIMQAVNRAATY